MTARHPAVVAEGTEDFGAGGTMYSAEYFVAGGTGAEDADNSGVGVGVCFGAAFLVHFVNFHPILFLHALLHCCKWDNAVPMCNSLQLV